MRALAQSHRFKVSRVKNRLDPSYIAGDGYRDVLCNVEIGDGCIGEVQINLSQFVDLKESSGHACYEASRMIHFASNSHHVSSAAGWASRAAARCPADEMRPLCLAERVSTGQLTQLSLKADASTPFPARDELRRSLSSPFVRLRRCASTV